MKIIKLTKKQLKEAEGNSFDYLNNSDTKSHNGQTEISANGKLNDDEYGNPITTDKASSTLTPQTYNMYGSYAQNRHKSIYEDVDDGINTFYAQDELDDLSDGDKTNDNTKIPRSIIDYADRFLEKINNSHISDRNKAMVLYKIIKELSIKNIPESWIKNIITMLRP